MKVTAPLGLATLCALALWNPMAWGQDAPSQRKKNQEKENSAQTAEADRQATPNRAARDESRQVSGPTGASNQSTKQELKIIELKHRSPVQLQELWDMQQVRTTRAATGNETRSAGFRGTARAPLHFAYDEESSRVFVRGSAEAVGNFQKVVDAFDVEDGQLKAQQVGNSHLIPIRGKSANMVSGVLTQLGLNARTLRWADTHLIVIEDDGSEQSQSELQQIQQVVAAIQDQDSAKTENNNNEGNTNNSRSKNNNTDRERDSSNPSEREQTAPRTDQASEAESDR